MNKAQAVINWIAMWTTPIPKDSWEFGKYYHEFKEEKSEHEFSSTQVDLPIQIVDAIKKYGEQILDVDIYVDPKDPSYGRQENIHITVKYGIHTADSEEVREVIESSSPIKAKLGNVSLFEADDYDVVKVEVDSLDLHVLNKLISKSTKVTDTHPTYNPHVTIAFVKKGKGKSYVGDTFAGKEVIFDEVVFSGKDGKKTTISFLGKKENNMSLAKEVTNVLEEVSGEDIAKAMLKKTIKKELEKKPIRNDGVAGFSKAAMLRLVAKKT